jgi:(2Fe-2S) ferredoxin
MNQANSPYLCHIFVCINDRHGERQSCADGMSAEIKDYLKEQVDKRGWKPRVRVSHSGCMGLCAKGPNVMLYPQGVWFGAVTLADADRILDKVAEFVK